MCVYVHVNRLNSYANSVRALTVSVVCACACAMCVCVCVCTCNQVTLIREYCQGPNGLCWNLPSGGFDPSCHKTLADCARAELSEEV